MKCDIIIKETIDVFEAICAAKEICKALNIEVLYVDCRNGIKLQVHKDSNLSDVSNIYVLESKLLNSKI